MNEKEYLEGIPIFCKIRTVQGHIDHLLLCWGIASGRPQKCHDVEGPHYCHGCEYSISAKRHTIMQRKIK